MFPLFQLPSTRITAFSLLSLSNLLAKLDWL
jgi:hypothetical protein